MKNLLVTLAITTLIGLAAGCHDTPNTRRKADADATPPTRAKDKSPAADGGPANNGSSAQAAADVLRRYYAAIDQGDYATAYALWGNNGKSSGKTLADFRKGFADTATSHVKVDASGQLEGAAGSSYITIPVTVTATLNNGKTQRFEGQYVLRRVNDVPGASASERRWHIHSANIHDRDTRVTRP